MAAFDFATLISDGDHQPFGQKGFFTQPLRQRVKVVFRKGKNAGVRLKGDFGTAPFGGAGLAKRTSRNAPFKFLFIGFVVAIDLNSKCLG